MNLTVESVFREKEQFCEETMHKVGIRPKVLSLCLYAVCCAAVYGATMGMNTSVLQAVVSAIKVPVLFLLTLAISLPTLHFVGLLFGSTIRFSQSITILLAGIALTSILLAAFAPISLLFLASGSEYPFLLLMHVAIFAFCGAAGLYSVQRNFAHIRSQPPDGANASISNHVLRIWMVLYMFVGTQTAWVLAPFIDRQPGFTLFNHAPGNFYTYVWSVILELVNK